MQDALDLVELRRCKIEITYGAEVEDKNGKLLGTVNNVVRDSWTGDLRRFEVKTSLADTDLFYSPEDVLEASETKVKLKVAFGEVNTSIRYGAKVFDKNNKFVGTVDYPINDPTTGEVKKFKVKTESVEETLLFSKEDVEKSAPNEVRLNIALAKPR